MSGNFRVIPNELRGASTGWDAEVFDLHAVPPSLQPPAPWPTMLASVAVIGAAQAATAELHTRITDTAGATQVAAASYEANEAASADRLKNVITTISGAVRDNA
jgi:hypothetical protein